MELQNGRRSEHDGCADQPRRTHQQCADAGDEPIRCFEVRGPLPRSIEYEHLLLDPQSFGDNRTQPARAEKPSPHRNEVDPQDNQVALREIFADLGQGHKT